MRSWGLNKTAAAVYGLLTIPILVWALLVLPNDATLYAPDRFPSAYMISGSVVQAIVGASPLVASDISIFGEITPIIMAGAIIALLRSSREAPRVPAICLAIVAYLLFLHLSIYFYSGPGADLLSSVFDNIEKPQKSLLSLVANVRVMVIVIAGAMLGLTIKNGSKLEAANESRVSGNVSKEEEDG
jgi:hypothetical protein